MPDSEARATTAAAVAAEAATTAAAATTDAAAAKAAALVGSEALAAKGHLEAAAAAATSEAVAAALTAIDRRGINRIWELTQATIAIIVVTTVMFIALRDGEIPSSLCAIAASIITAYFNRTNHDAVGGVGPPQRRGE